MFQYLNISSLAYHKFFQCLWAEIRAIDVETNEIEFTLWVLWVDWLL